MSTEKHPSYDQFLTTWELLKHSFQGEDEIKAQRVRYLPPTAGMIIDGMTAPNIGYQCYSAYLQRALYPESFFRAVVSFCGLILTTPHQIKSIGANSDSFMDNCTLKSESLIQVLGKIHELQMLYGRCGVLVDVSAKGKVNLFVYNPIAIVDWETNDEGEIIRLVLDETGHVRENGKWVHKEKYLSLSISENGVYNSVTINGAGKEISEVKVPAIFGKKLNKIPFVFINTRDIAAEPDRAPLISIARLALAVYRGEADLRQVLHVMGQDTLVLIGANVRPGEPVRVGSGARIDLDQGSDAKYIGISGAGIGHLIEVLASDKALLQNLSGQIIEKGSVESGEALRIRSSDRALSLQQISVTACSALQELCNIIKDWMLTGFEIEITANTDFETGGIDVVLMKETIAGYMQGAIPPAEYVRLMQEAGVFSTDQASEDLIEQMGQTIPAVPAVPGLPV